MSTKTNSVEGHCDCGERCSCPPGSVQRAVEYGRMRAFEEFACSIEEGFRFEQFYEDTK